MKYINIEDFKITEPVSIADCPTRIELDAATDRVEKKQEKLRVRLGKLQDELYAHGKYSVLVCLQGMDTAGKDSLIREVFKDFNARGVVVHSFKQPTSLELGYDYLWRHIIALPPRGKFGVFNRTHYENLLVTRVHPEYILNENIPGINSVDDIDDDFWEARFDQVNNFEKHITDNGTIVFKFFLNLSKEEQRHRLLRRLEKRKKHWKFSPADMKERKLWEKYQWCFEEILNKTSKPNAYWYNIPADDKPVARYLVTKIMYDTLKTYTDIKEPELDPKVEARLDEYMDILNKEE
ncbi:MAG: phosphate--nucleotide phosphotransferase [Bacteroidetes bacterium MedPE-SWsnd-G2]|nr:MAG: phosphate--nucleotide phosphotransferase [Bacteroidetes bacterium MedPE-SWsnd-G2]